MLFLKAPHATGDYLVGWEEDPKLVSAGFIWIKPGHPLIDDLRRHASDENPIPGWFPLWKRAYLAARKAAGRPQHVSDLDWGVIGPNLLTWLLRRHNKQLKEQTINTDILRHSLFGLVYIYNLLPQSIIDLRSVRQFQSVLQRALRLAASQRLPSWEYLFSPRLRPVRDVHFQLYFDS